MDVPTATVFKIGEGAVRADLDARLELETPEQVVVSLPLAGVGSRMGAYGIDLTIRFALWLLIVVPAIFVWVNYPGLGGYAAAIAIIGHQALQFGYYIYFELAHRGQTPGKRRLGLRTVRQNGGPVDFLASVLRNLLRIVDWLPCFYGLGVAVMFCSSSEQRLGDVTAGTVVVREKRPEARARGLDLSSADYERVCHELQLLHPERIRVGLTKQEAELVARFLSRLPVLDPAKAANLSGRIRARLRNRVVDPEGALQSHFSHPGIQEALLRMLLESHLREQQGPGVDSEAT